MTIEIIGTIFECIKIKKQWKELESSDDLHESLQICSKIKNLDPNDSRLYLHMARIHVELKEYSHANDFFLTSIEKEKEVTLDPLIEYSEFLIDNNRHAESLDYCERVLEKDSNNIDAHHIKSKIYLKTGQFPLALELVEYVLEREKNNVRALFTKSMVLRSLRRYSEALQVIDNALKIDENNIRNLHGKSLILCDQLDYDSKSNDVGYIEALGHIEAILRMDKNNIEALNVKSWIMIKFGEQNIGMYQTEPDSPELPTGKNVLVYDVGLDCCNKVLSLDEHNFSASYHKCVMLFDSEKYEQAIKLCEEMFRDSGNDKFKELHKELKNELLKLDGNRIGGFLKPNKFMIMMFAIGGSLTAIFTYLVTLSAFVTYVTPGTGIKGLILFSILFIISIVFLHAMIQSYIEQNKKYLKFNPKDIPDLG